MNKFKNIFILFISLLFVNGGLGKNMSNNLVQKNAVITHTHNFVLNAFVENSFPNDNFDLEEDYDDSDDDFTHIITSKSIITLDEHAQKHIYSYSYSFQSVKRFILYCSLKLHC